MKQYDFFTFLDRLTFLQAETSAEAFALEKIAASLGLPPERRSDESVRASEGDPGGPTGTETAAGEVGDKLRTMPEAA